MGFSPRHGSHAAAPIASNIWLDGSIIIPLCRSSRTDCQIGFGNCSLSLGVYFGCLCKILLELIFDIAHWANRPRVFVRILLSAAAHVLARGSCRFILVRLHKGKYLKYWYSIFKEQWKEFLPPHYICRWEGVFDTLNFENFSIFSKFHITCTKFSAWIC